MFPLSNELSWGELSATHNADGCPFPARNCTNIRQISRSGMPGLSKGTSRQNVAGTLAGCLACCGAISAKAPIEYQADNNGLTPTSSSRHRERLLAGEDETSE
jgi:hypothetical protein